MAASEAQVQQRLKEQLTATREQVLGGYLFNGRWIGNQAGDGALAKIGAVVQIFAGFKEQLDGGLVGVGVTMGHILLVQDTRGYWEEACIAWRDVMACELDGPTIVIEHRRGRYVIQGNFLAIGYIRQMHGEIIQVYELFQVEEERLYTPLQLPWRDGETEAEHFQRVGGGGYTLAERETLKSLGYAVGEYVKGSQRLAPVTRSSSGRTLTEAEVQEVLRTGRTLPKDENARRLAETVVAEVLREQTTPQPGRSLKVVGGANYTEPEPMPAPAPVQALQNASPAADAAKQLVKLGEMYQEGLLTADEFATMKRRLLAG